MSLQLHHEHAWEVSAQQAIKIQEDLRAHISIQPLSENDIRYVGGVDTAFYDDLIIAAVVVLDFPTLDLSAQATAVAPITFPYVPGLLSFRETPAVLACLAQLENLPHVLIVDGHGLAHPRRFGIASHIGVLLNIPTIGCAKSLLIGKHASLPESVGSSAEIRHGEEIVGVALRTRSGVKPIFLSIGNMMDLPSAVQIVLACQRGYRLPEPSRRAHNLANQKRWELRKN